MEIQRFALIASPHKPGFLFANWRRLDHQHYDYPKGDPKVLIALSFLLHFV